MSKARSRNVFGAFALMISDDIVSATSACAPEVGPAASALALLDHEPGLSIRMLAAGVGLSHAGTVRLVDRMEAEGLLERRGNDWDGRTRALYLTPSGKSASRAVLDARDKMLSRILSVLSSEELATLSDLAERMLRVRLRDVEHMYRVCRLCAHSSCGNCPIDDELRQRGLR